MKKFDETSRERVVRILHTLKTGSEVEMQGVRRDIEVELEGIKRSIQSLPRRLEYGIRGGDGA